MLALRKLLIAVLILLALALSMLFALQNKTPVPLDLLIYQFSPRSVSLWVLLAFATGGLLGILASSGVVLRLRTALMANKRQLNKVRGELDSLREQS